MEGLAEDGVGLGRGVDEGPDLLLGGHDDAVEDAFLVAVDRVPGRGAIGVIGLVAVGVLGAFREEDASHAGLPADVEVIAAIGPLLDAEVAGTEGEGAFFRGKGKGQGEEEGCCEPRGSHPSMIGSGRPGHEG